MKCHHGKNSVLYMYVFFHYEDLSNGYLAFHSLN